MRWGCPVGIPKCSVDFNQTPCIGGGGVRRWDRRSDQRATERPRGREGRKSRSADREPRSRLGAETPTRSDHSLGSGRSAETPLVRRRLVRTLLTRKDPGGSPDHRISEISSVARRTLRSVWPDRGALPEVRGRADRVGSLADGQGDRNGPLAPPGAGRRCRSAGSGDVPGPAGQGETLHWESPNEFHRSRVVEIDDHVDLGAPRS